MRFGLAALSLAALGALTFFWVAGIAALGRLVASGDPRWWLGIGAAAGTALLSKYTGLLFIAGIGGWLLFTAPGRARLRGPWPWAGLVLALLIFLPNILWNAEHSWVSVLKQGSRLAQFDAARGAQLLAELLAGQFALATPLVFSLAACGLWRLNRAAAPDARALLWLAVVPGLVFLEHVVSGRVQANWPAVLYPSGCLAAAGLPAVTLRRWLAATLGLGMAMTVLTYTQAVAPFALPARADPVARQFAGWSEVATAAQRMAMERHGAFITSDEYATAAELAVGAGGGGRRGGEAGGGDLGGGGAPAASASSATMSAGTISGCRRRRRAGSASC